MKEEELIWRPPTQADATKVLDFMRECDRAEYGEPDTDLDDLLHDWRQMDLARDAWLVLDRNGSLLAYAGVTPAAGDFQYDLFLAPGAAAQTLGEALLSRCDQRARHLLAAGESATARVVSYTAHVNKEIAGLLRDAGFRPVKYHCQMWIGLDRPVPALTFPPGVTLRPFRLGEDEQAVHTLVQEAFDRAGRSPQTLGEWKKFMMRPGLFDPALWLLAFDDSRLVGVCLAFTYPGMGWVRQLAVDPGFQGRGLGSVLLTHAFRIFQERGLDQVGLGVAGDNDGAQRFYLRLGMQIKRQYDEYRKELVL